MAGLDHMMHLDYIEGPIPSLYGILYLNSRGKPKKRVNSDLIQEENRTPCIQSSSSVG